MEEVLIWFGFTKFLTSLARWVFQAPFLPWAGWILVSPPFLKRQIIYHLATKTARAVQVSSYFDWATLHEIFVRREYDTSIFSHDTEVQIEYKGILEEGKQPLILDLGANVGFASIFFGSIFPLAKIIGLEPSENNFANATKNLHGTPNAEMILAAVGTSDGWIEFYDPGLGNNAFRTFGEDSQLVSKVQSRSIASLIQQYPELQPFFLKIDIEGFEKELFTGDCSWIDSFKVIAIEIHDWMMPGQSISTNLLKALGGRNRDLVFRGENLFSIRNGS